MSVNAQQVKALLDLSVSSSAAGVHIPIGYGETSMGANIIWSPGLQETVTKINFVGQPQLTLYNYTVSFAAAFCEGPGVITKIWGDTQILYDNTGTYVNYQGLFNSSTLYNVGEIVRADSGTGAERFYICVNTATELPFPAPGGDNNCWQVYTGGVAVAGGQAFPSPTLYTGSDIQNADPTIQAALGVGKTPAFRGLVYAVWANLDVSLFNNRIPSIRGVVLGGIPTATPPIVTSGLDYIVQDLCTRSGIEVDEIDASDLAPVVTTSANIYQSDGSGIPALTLISGGTVTFYQSAAGGGAPFLYTYPGKDSNYPLPAPKLVYKMTDTQTIMFNPYPAQQDSTTGSYTSFLPGWTELTSYDLEPMVICGVAPGGAGPATYDGTAYAPFTPANVGGFAQANWDMTVVCKVQIAVAGNYTFYCSSNDAVVIGIGNGATRVSGPMVMDGRTMTVTAEKGYPVIMAEQADLGENDAVAQPHLDSILSTFVVNFPTVGTYGIELDYAQHSGARCLCLNWQMGSVQSPLLPVAGSDGASPAGIPFGYLVNEAKDARTAIEELKSAFFFDGAESDFALKFVRRGAHPPALTITEGDLGLVQDNAKLSELLTQEQDAPRSVTCNFTDPAFDYQQGSQTQMRSSRVVTSISQTTIELAVLALSQTLARQIAEKTLFIAWMERQPYQFNLWKAVYALLDPTDVVSFVYEGQVYQERLLSVGLGQNLTVKLDGRFHSAAAYASFAQGAGNTPVDPTNGWGVSDGNGYGLGN
jgi:hypothetical protein